jgi:DNA modification methylase
MVGRNAYEAGATVPYRDRCGKCGAVRVDRQLGLESVPDCSRLTAPALDVLLRGDLDDAQLAEALDLIARLRPYLAFKEPCGACYVCHLVEVFRAVRRTLRDDGTVWLNLGDSYNTYAANRGNGRSTLEGSKQTAPLVPAGYGLSAKGLKPKDLVGIPWRVALALQADGWTLRSEVIWSKKSCMPESVRDRPTRSHEQVFLLSKKAAYFYDAEAVREESTSPDQDAHNQRYAREYDYDLPKPGNGKPGSTNHAGLHSRPGPGGRNMRSVWHLGPSPFPDAHFATFVPEIPRRAILAGTSERGCCPACLAPWVRVVEVTRGPAPAERGGKNYGMNAQGTSPTSALRRVGGDDWYEYAGSTRTTGWSPSCRCDAGDPIPCTVLDPFAGAGTTGLVADRLGRSSVLIELNPEYAAMSERRIRKDAPLFNHVEAEATPVAAASARQPALWEV